MGSGPEDSGENNSLHQQNSGSIFLQFKQGLSKYFLNPTDENYFILMMTVGELQRNCEISSIDQERLHYLRKALKEYHYIHESIHTLKEEIVIWANNFKNPNLTPAEKLSYEAFIRQAETSIGLLHHKEHLTHIGISEVSSML